MKRARLISIALLCLSACASLGTAPWSQDTLYFGLNRPGGAVSEDEWQAFVDAELTPRFPDGLTQLNGQGQWKGKDGVVKEASRVVILLHPSDSASERKIEALREAYKLKFHQESVLRVQQKARADF